MKNRLLLLSSLLFLVLASFASAENVSVDVGIIVDGDADVSVTCEASGTCEVNIQGEPFEEMNKRWSEDNDIGKKGVAHLFRQSVGCVIGAEYIYGERIDCKLSSVKHIANTLNIFIATYLQPVDDKLEYVLQRQDRIIVQQRMLMSHFDIAFNETAIAHETLKETARRTGMPVLTSDGYTCDFINDLFICTASVSEVE